MSSYKSFRRQLNLYGIYQHRHRPNQDANAYSHELLIRGQRHLCDKIARKKTNPPGKSKGSSSSKNVYGNEKGCNNKKRNRSSLLAMMEQRNMKMSSEGVGQHDSKLSDVNMRAVPTLSKSSNSIDAMRRNMLMKSIYDDEVSTRPNPVDINKISNGIGNGNNLHFNNNNDNNVFQSFMSQYWEDLPNNVSSSQVVDEIIATFQQN